MALRPITRSRSWTSALAALTVGLVAAVGAAPAAADTRPLDPTTTPATVAADALPTVQIDGVVWSQVVVGRTVYAVGKFTTARPAGSAPGVNTVARHNMLAYDIETGQLVPGFAPVLNAQAVAITKSPDGKRIYIAGDFTRVNGVYRVGVAAFDTATGTLVSGFRPTLSAKTLSVAATNDTVYVGGNFTSAASVTGGTLQPRAYLAAFRASTGELKPFRADADAPVTALAVTADGGKVVVGGRFLNLSGTAMRGLGAVDPVSGAPLSFPTNQYVKNAGSNASITSLYADTSGVYGTGYRFGSGGNLEGSFRAHATTGEMIWVADCHGDAYSVFPQGDVVYTSSHHHYCGNVPGGFPQEEPWTFYHGNAFTKARTGTNLRDIYGKPHHAGEPAPTMLNWYPTFQIGSFTGQNQATWSVAGNDRYLVMGGEFPGLNGQKQQGLVRFVRPDAAPNKQGPRISATAFNPRTISYAPGTVRVNWRGNWDRDNRTLTYRLYREGTSAPIHERTVTAPFFRQPSMGFTDSGRAAGSTQRYRITATDPFGNVAQSNLVSVTVTGSGKASPYVERVYGDGVTAFWRLGEGSGTTVTDWAGFDDARAGTGVRRGVTGAVSGNTASSFDGTTNGYAASTVGAMGPETFSIETWVRTTTTSGGKLVGFGNAQTGDSSKYDRHVYMDNAGKLYFGVNSGALRTINSTGSYNDGRWHHVVATLGSGGMQLFVDGAKVAGRTDTRTAQRFRGFWRIGGDRLSSSWAGTKTSGYLNGALDEVAIYPAVLSAEAIAGRYAAATGTTVPGDDTSTTNAAPTASFSATVSDLTVSVDGSASTDADGSVVGYAWDFGNGVTATGVKASTTYTASGTYTVRLTVTDDRGATATTTKDVTVTAPTAANEAPTAAFTSTVSGLSVSVDGSGSKDAEGPIASYAWDFGNGAKGTGVKASTTYAAAGTYTVRLTVTDGAGATATTARDVTVTAPVAETALARDAFTREVASGWGPADLGGTWASSGSASAHSVTGGQGVHRIPSAGAQLSSTLGDVSSTATDLRLTLTLADRQTGGGTYVTVAGRKVGSSSYAGRLRFLSDGRVTVSAMNGGTTLQSTTLPGLTYTAGEALHVRVRVAGTSPTTIAAKVWRVGTTEPVAWQVSTTDSTAALQTGGGISLTSYLSGSATLAPMGVRYDDLVVDRAE